MIQLVAVNHNLCVKRFMVRGRIKRRNSHPSSFLHSADKEHTPPTFLLSLSLNGCNVVDIDFDRRGLLNQAHTSENRWSGFFGSSGLSRLLGLSGLSSMIFDETRDDSACFVACLQIPSRRSLLQQDEDANGTVSTHHAQAARRKI